MLKLHRTKYTQMPTSKTDKICVRSEDFIKAAMLAVILHYSLTRCYLPLGKTGEKVLEISLYSFLQQPVDRQFSQSKSLITCFDSKRVTPNLTVC